MILGLRTSFWVFRFPGGPPPAWCRKPSFDVQLGLVAYYPCTSSVNLKLRLLLTSGRNSSLRALQESLAA